MKRLFIALSLAVLFAVSAAAQTVLSTTTLGAAVTSTSANTIRVASISGIVANSGLWVDQEFMTVTATPATGTLTVSVFRGAAGTKAATHISGATVTLGPQNAFQSTDPPWGTCSRSALPNGTQYLPWINVQTGNVCTCDSLYTTSASWRCTNSKPIVFNSLLVVIPS